MSRLCASLVLLGVLVSGCGGSDLHKSSPSPSDRSTTSEDATSPDARPSGPGNSVRELAAAQKQLISAGSGRFTLAASLNGSPLNSDEGGYDLLASVFEVTRVAHTPDDRLVTYVRVIDGVTYLQMVGWKAPLTGCWLRQPPPEGPTAAERFSSGEIGPPGVTAVLIAEATGYAADGSIRALIPGSLALQLLGVSSSHLADFEGAARGDAPATIMLKDGRVRWMWVVGSDAAAFFAKAGVTLEPDLVEALGLMKARLDLSIGVPVAVETPSRDLLMASTGDQMAGCPATTG